MRMFKFAAACGVAISCAIGAGGAASALDAPNPAMLEYSLIKPCRAFDTRSTTPVAANQTRGFHITGSNDFEEQGGTAHGCGVPAYATAVSLSLISLNQAAAGYLTAFAYNSSRPGTVSLYYQPNATITNTVIVPINQSNISVFSNKQSHVAGDVTGYYAPKMHAYVSALGDLLSGSRVVSVSRTSVGAYKVVFDRILTGCSMVASSDYTAHMTAANSSESNVYVYMYDKTGAAVDYWFHLIVSC